MDFERRKTDKHAEHAADGSMIQTGSFLTFFTPSSLRPSVPPSSPPSFHLPAPAAAVPAAAAAGWPLTNSTLLTSTSPGSFSS